MASGWQCASLIFSIGQSGGGYGTAYFLNARRTDPYPGFDSVSVEYLALLSGCEMTGDLQECFLMNKRTAEEEADAACVADNDSADFQQFRSRGLSLGIGQFSSRQSQAT